MTTAHYTRDTMDTWKACVTMNHHCSQTPRTKPLHGNEFDHRAEPQLRHQHAHHLRSHHENIHDVPSKTLKLIPIALSGAVSKPKRLATNAIARRCRVKHVRGSVQHWRLVSPERPKVDQVVSSSPTSGHIPTRAVVPTVGYPARPAHINPAHPRKVSPKRPEPQHDQSSPRAGWVGGFFRVTANPQLP